MNPIIRNIVAVIAGLIVGSFVNMSLIMVSGSMIPPPAGADMTTMEGLQAAMPLMEPKHFVMPFLAHALGTFVGALVAAMIAVSHKMMIALGIAVFFMLGGLLNAFLLPAPVWFIALDLIVAYLPMGYLAGMLASRRQIV